MATKIQIASRKFGRKTWTLNRFVRDNGTGYTELDDGEYVSDSPVRYHDGRVVYDRPEQIPQAVRVWVSSSLDRYVREARQGSETLEGISARTRKGSRVRFEPASRASLVLYTHHPEIGEEGTVTTMPGFGSRTYLPGPGGGLLYVKWDQSGTIGVAPNDLQKA